MTPLVLLFILAFLVSVDLRILAPVLPSISESLRASPGVVGLAMTSYAITYGTGQLFYGPLSDRRGRVAVVRAAGLGFSLCTVLAALSGTTLELQVGYSHPVRITPRQGIEFEVPAPTQIVVRGIDKQMVGQTAAEIRKVRPPEPYKGKGIRYTGEYVRRKVGKRA